MRIAQKKNRFSPEKIETYPNKRVRNYSREILTFTRATSLIEILPFLLNNNSNSRAINIDHLVPRTTQVFPLVLLYYLSQTYKNACVLSSTLIVL